ncbi:MAG: ComEC/Rec2 family competence protein [Ruminococcaceae bacterium]|nr:ComEC/Rec2 family competence protein [Oscillospiraceae bacterium]
MDIFDKQSHLLYTFYNSILKQEGGLKVKILKNRPLATACLCFCLMFSLGFFFGPEIKFLVFTLLILFFLVFVLLKNIIKGSKEKFDSVLYLLIFLAVSLALLCSYLYADNKLYASKELCGSVHTVEAEVISVTDRSFDNFSSCEAQIEIKKIDGKPVEMLSDLKTDFCTGAKIGNIIRLNLYFYEYDNSRIFGTEIYKRADGYLLRSEAHGLKDSKFRILGECEPNSAELFFKSLSSKASNSFKTHLSEKSAGFMSALLIGDKTHLAASVKNDFTYLGLSHMLAVSGMHFSVLFGMLTLFLTLISVPKRTRAILLIAFSIVFMLLCGMSPSVSRAGSMFIIFCICGLLNGENDSFTSLLLSYTLIIISDPASFFDIGLILSVFATLGVLLSLSVIKKFQKIPFIKKHKLISYISSSLITTCMAVLFSLPFIWMSFGSISLISPISNLLLSPVVSLLLVLSPFLLLLSPVPVISSVIAFSAELLCGITFGLSSALAKINGMSLSLDYPFTKHLLLFCLLCIFAVFIFSPKRKSIYTIPVILCISAFFALSAYYNSNTDDEIFIYSYNGSNDLAIVKSGRKVSFIDGTKGNYSEIKEGIGYVKSKYKLLEIESYIVSGYGKDLTEILPYFANTVKIHSIKAPSPQKEEDIVIAYELEKICRENGIPLDYFDRKEVCLFKNNDLFIEIPPTKNLNSEIYAYLVKCDNKKLLVDGATVPFEGRTEELVPYAENADAVLVCVSVKPRYRRYDFAYSLENTKRLIFADIKAKEYFTNYDMYADIAESVRAKEKFIYSFSD